MYVHMYVKMINQCCLHSVELPKVPTVSGKKNTESQTE
jgi:hypothetical protein